MRSVAQQSSDEMGGLFTHAFAEEAVLLPRRQEAETEVVAPWERP